MRLEPGLVSIKDLLLKAHSGDWSLWLPSFQRRFVWDPVDIKVFFDSLLKGNPVGILLLWRSGSPENLDPFALRVLVGEDKSSENYLIVDGQQRVLSLLLLLNGWRVKVGDIEYSRQPISFNPTKFLEVGRRGLDLSEGMRAHLGLKDVDDLRRKYASEYVDRLLGLCEKIASYKIPVYFMDLDDERSPLERAAEVFILANRAGQRITNVELMLSYVSGVLIPEASSIIRRSYDELQAEFKELDSTALIRYSFGVGLDLKQRQIDDVERFRSAVRGLATQVDLTGRSVLGRGLEASIPFFRSAIGLVRRCIGRAAPSFLTTQLSLVVLATYMHSRGYRDPGKVPEADVEAVRDWLVLVNFHGYYSANPSGRLQKDIETVKGSSGPFPFDDLLSNIKETRGGATTITASHIMRGLDADLLRRSGQPYLFVLYTALCLSGASDWEGTLIRELESESLARHHLFPRSLFRTVGEEEGLISGMGNITLISPSLNSELSDKPPVEYLHQYRDELRKHFIPEDRELWGNDRFEEGRADPLVPEGEDAEGCEVRPRHRPAARGTRSCASLSWWHS
jgi:hypothetical protein